MRRVNSKHVVHHVSHAIFFHVLIFYSSLTEINYNKPKVYITLLNLKKLKWLPLLLAKLLLLP